MTPIDPTPQPQDYEALQTEPAFRRLFEEPQRVEQQGDYIRFHSGIHIHQSCLSARPDFPRIVHESWREGMACLNRIGGRGAEENLNRFAWLMANAENPLKLSCPASHLFEKDVLGTGTIPGKPEHPLIKINIQNPFLHLPSTLFHELFHNANRPHGLDVEYAYACQGCCRKDNPQTSKSSEFKQIECQICQGNFTSVLDPNYFEIMLQYYALSKERTIQQYHEGMHAFFLDHYAIGSVPQQRMLALLIAHDIGGINFPQEHPALFMALKEHQASTLPDLEQRLNYTFNNPIIELKAPQPGTLRMARRVAKALDSLAHQSPEAHEQLFDLLEALPVQTDAMDVEITELAQLRLQLKEILENHMFENYDYSKNDSLEPTIAQSHLNQSEVTYRLMKEFFPETFD